MSNVLGTTAAVDPSVGGKANKTLMAFLAADASRGFILDEARERLSKNGADIKRLPGLKNWARERYPKDPRDSDFVYKQTIKAKACDAIRGVLPAATLSNVGIYGTGQGYEALLLRMRAHPLPEARAYSAMKRNAP